MISDALAKKTTGFGMGYSQSNTTPEGVFAVLGPMQDRPNPAVGGPSQTPKTSGEIPLDAF